MTEVGDHTSHPVTDIDIRYDKIGSAYRNLLDACPAFQFEGNFGGTVAIAEMLFPSYDNQISLFPALPKSWSCGAVTGIWGEGFSRSISLGKTAT